jgi:integrase
MLTNAQCTNAKCPQDKNRLKLSDSGGLYLEVSPAGAKRWFLKYRKEGAGAKAGQLVESRMALGNYPSVSLIKARQARDAAKLQKSEGIDPVGAKKLQKLKANISEDSTFKFVALDWFNKQSPNWSASHATRTKRNLVKDLCPFIGNRAMSEIQPLELLAAVLKVEERGSLETAKRVLDTAGQVWNFWLPTAPAQQRNITEGLKARLTPRVKGHFSAITDPVRFGELMRSIRAYKGGPLVRVALQLAPLLYQRPANLRMMEWAELDFEGALWTIPSAKMKRTLKDKEDGKPHVVPLPSQAIELLQSLKPLTGGGVYVFQGERDHDRAMSDNSVRSALYALGYGKEQSWHGFRASARTMIVDELNLDPLAIEANLAHAVKDSNGRSYNRTQYLKQRFEMVQQWADYIDTLAAGNVVDMAARKAA